MIISENLLSIFAQAKKLRRVSVAALLLIPLVLSPAFLSLYFASDVFAHRMQEFSAATWILGFAYSLVLTLFWYWGNGGPGPFKHSFTWFLRRGASVGVLYGLLLCVPLEIIKAAVLAGRMSVINIVGQTIVPAIAILVFSALTGLAAGGLLGLYLPRQNTRTAKAQ